MSKGDRVEDDARDAEINVLVRPRRETAVGAGAHDTFLDARVCAAATPEELEKRGLCPAGYSMPRRHRFSVIAL